MEIPLREIQIPIIIIGVIVGYQLSFYFLTQYKRYKEERLGLNRILLAYGIFFLLGLNGILMRNIHIYFIEDPLVSVILLKITNLLMVATIFSFNLIISSKSFTPIVRSKISIIFTIISGISMPPIFFFESNSMILNVLTIPAIIGILYIWYFQIKLIRYSEPTFKRRLIMIFIGQLLLLAAFLVRGEFSRVYILQSNEQNVIIFTSTTSILILIFIFLGVYRFPAFLEFNWRENLKKLFIIDKNTHTGLYSHDFELKQEIDPSSITSIDANVEKDRVYSKSLIGIDQIIQTITRSEEGKSKKITIGDYNFMYKYADAPYSSVMFVLIVKKEMISFSYLLNSIKSQFQGFYKDILLELESIIGIEELFFSSFDVLLNNLIQEK